MLPAGVDSQKDREHLRNCSKAKNTAFGGEKKMPKSSPHKWLPTKKKKKKKNNGPGRQSLRYQNQLGKTMAPSNLDFHTQLFPHLDNCKLVFFQLD